MINWILNLLGLKEKGHYSCLDCGHSYKSFSGKKKCPKCKSENIIFYPSKDWE